MLLRLTHTFTHTHTNQETAPNPHFNMRRLSMYGLVEYWKAT